MFPSFYKHISWKYFELGVVFKRIALPFEVEIWPGCYIFTVGFVTLIVWKDKKIYPDWELDRF